MGEFDFMGETLAIQESEVAAFQRARLSRDPRFDGVFFVGVLSTGIYCRPVCPAPLPKESNVRYFASAQQAAMAGLRPCLRCRPESAPGSSPWRGNATTLGRAMALIDSGALFAADCWSEDEAKPADEPRGEEGGRVTNKDAPMEALAARLGVGSRYLRKLFTSKLGMSPKAFGDYRRLLLAKALLHQTSLPVTDIAFAAGFGSVRRFNEVFQQKLSLTPSQLRSNAKALPGLVLSLSVRPPYDFESLRQFFMARAIGNNEWFSSADGRPCIGKVLTVSGIHGWFEATQLSGKNALSIAIYPGEDVARLSVFLAQIKRVLDLDANLAMVNAQLESVLLAQGTELPGDGWQCMPLPGAGSYLEACCRAVLGQQVSLKQATMLLNKLVDAYGEKTRLGGRECQLFPAPQALMDADFAELAMPGARKEALRSLGKLFSEAMEPADGAILAIKGIGPWTLGYARMRGLSDPDVLLIGDLVVRQRLELLGLTQSATELQRAVSPWGSYLTLALWRCDIR